MHGKRAGRTEAGGRDGDSEGGSRPEAGALDSADRQALWSDAASFLSAQSLADNVLHSRAPILLSELSRMLATSDFQGSSSTALGAISALRVLADRDSSALKAAFQPWAPPLWQLMLAMPASGDELDTDACLRLRREAQDCVSHLLPTLCSPSFSPALPKSLARVLFRDLIDRMQKMTMGVMDLEAGLRPQGVRLAQDAIAAWSLFTVQLGVAFLKVSKLGERMLNVVRRTFTHCEEQLAISTFHAWHRLVDSFVACSMLARHWRVLCQPITHSLQYDSRWSVKQAALVCWLHLVRQLGMLPEGGLDNANVFSRTVPPILELLVQTCTAEEGKDKTGKTDAAASPSLLYKIMPQVFDTFTSLATPQTVPLFAGAFADHVIDGLKDDPPVYAAALQLCSPLLARFTICLQSPDYCSTKTSWRSVLRLWQSVMNGLRRTEDPSLGTIDALATGINVALRTLPTCEPNSDPHESHKEKCGGAMDGNAWCPGLEDKENRDNHVAHQVHCNGLVHRLECLPRELERAREAIERLEEPVGAANDGALTVIADKEPGGVRKRKTNIHHGVDRDNAPGPCCRRKVADHPAGGWRPAASSMCPPAGTSNAPQAQTVVLQGSGRHEEEELRSRAHDGDALRFCQHVQRGADDPLSARDVAELEVNQTEEDALKLQGSATKLRGSTTKVSAAGSTPLTGATERVHPAGSAPSPPHLLGGSCMANPDLSSRGLAHDESCGRGRAEYEPGAAPTLAYGAKEFVLAIRKLAEGIASSGAGATELWAMHDEATLLQRSIERQLRRL
ncbi:unnamed protein product [Ostreobium quekettii]|uniref:Telomere-associated protein Rif1 N-terminal domain-containing protein n=1 Tax=Ostreobium quekettii TaxID=121088 RepID=A0A8S1J016_9CHLO|nr:unnamed protein product [Ostreobium quekettii]|eukprot:evm.model.scf_107.9 EVM.evm.TU.scf_107.9   scf_107:119591-132244(+)